MCFFDDELFLLFFNLLRSDIDGGNSAMRSFFRSSLARFHTVSALLLGIFLVALAVVKAIQPAETVAALEWAFGGSAAKPLFAVLLGLELCLAALLLALVRPRVVLTATSVTFGVFLLWIGYLIRTDAPVSCGCGTASLFGIANDDLHAAFVRTSVLFVWTLAALVSATIYTRGPRAGAASRTEMEDFRCDPVHPS